MYIKMSINHKNYRLCCVDFRVEVSLGASVASASVLLAAVVVGSY